jgi:hypothetical protein
LEAGNENRVLSVAAFGLSFLGAAKALGMNESAYMCVAVVNVNEHVASVK